MLLPSLVHAQRCSQLLGLAAVTYFALPFVTNLALPSFTTTPSVTDLIRSYTLWKNHTESLCDFAKACECEQKLLTFLATLRPRLSGHNPDSIHIVS